MEVQARIGIGLMQTQIEGAAMIETEMETALGTGLVIVTVEKEIEVIQILIEGVTGCGSERDEVAKGEGYKGFC